MIHMFQSSPAPRRGRYGRGCGTGAAGTVVSILARAEARALQTRAMEIRRVIIVSILARAEARALPIFFQDGAARRVVSILARAEARALL